jgi:hypothetical protein
MLAAERLALLDPARSAVYLQRFRARRDRIITPASGATLDALLAAVIAQRLPRLAGWEGDTEAIPRAWGALARKDLPETVKGYLAAELRNVTFVGEREAAVATLRNFAAFIATDAEVVGRVEVGNRADAVRLALADEPGGSLRAFREYDAALGQTLEINNREFGLAVNRGFAILTPFGLATPMVALGVALLAAAGLRPRLKEYAP